MKYLVLFLSLLSLGKPLCAQIDYYPSEDKELKKYLAEMPWQHYKNYYVPGLGSFWVDNAHDCVKDTIKSGNIWETYIIDLVKTYAKPGDRVIDIGGHMGSITLAMSNIVGEKGMVYTFEGERQFFRELVENIKINNKKNIKPHLTWISNEDKVIDATWFYGPEYSPVHLATERSYKLNVRKLDSFGYKKIALMKIDVECTEDAVLDGAYKTIMDSRPVLLIEIMGGFGNSNSAEVRSRIDHTISKLNAMKYTVTKVLIDDYLAIPNEKLK